MHYTGILIGRARRERGLEQAVLAHKLGVSPSALSHWERGERPFPMERITTAAEALGVAPEEVMVTVEIAGEGRRSCLRPPFPPGATLQQAASLGPSSWAAHQAARATLPREQYMLLDEFPRQTMYELAVAVKLAACHSRLALSAPGLWECPVQAMHDLDNTPADHLLQPAIIWEKAGERIVAFGQVPLNIPGLDPIRPDFLIRYQRARERAYWLALEIDDKSSQEEKHLRDQVRATRLALPILRFENHTVEKSWFFFRLLEDIRKLAPEAARRWLQQLRRARRLDRERCLEAERRRNSA